MGAVSLGRLILAAGLLGASAVPASVSAQTVGTTGAVNPSSTGTEPGGGAKTLKIGSNVVFKERIQTTAAGSLQVLFVDTTTLSVGPNSDMTIDEFVYNPNAGGGKFVASLSKGALRFVGGQISHKDGATVNTPSATIGIRGGGAYIEVRGNKVVVICTLGTCVADGPAGESVSLRPGNGVSMGGGAHTKFTPSPKLLAAFQHSIATGKPTSTGNDSFVLTEGEPKNAGNPGTPQNSQNTVNHTVPVDDPNTKFDVEQQNLADQAIEGSLGTQQGAPGSPTEPNAPFPPNPP